MIPHKIAKQKSQDFVGIIKILSDNIIGMYSIICQKILYSKLFLIGWVKVIVI